MNQEETRAVSPIRISKALEGMRSSEIYRRFIAGSDKSPRLLLDNVGPGFKDTVLSTRTSLLVDVDAVGVATDLSNSLDQPGPLEGSFNGLVRSKPISLCAELQDIRLERAAPFFINTLTDQTPTVQPNEHLFDSSVSTYRYLFRLFLFERFGADPDPRLPYAWELLVLFEWLFEIVAQLGEHRFTVRRNVAAGLDAVRRAACTRDRDDIFSAYRQLGLLEEVPSLAIKVVTKDLNAKRGRRVIEGVSLGGKVRASLYRARDAQIFQDFKELMCTGKHTKTSALETLAARSEHYAHPEIKKKVIGFGAIQRVVNKRLAETT